MITNAVKFTQKGTISVEISWEDDKKYQRISSSDTQPEVPEELRVDGGDEEEADIPVNNRKQYKNGIHEETKEQNIIEGVYINGD